MAGNKSSSAGDKHFFVFPVHAITPILILPFAASNPKDRTMIASGKFAGATPWHDSISVHCQPERGHHLSGPVPQPPGPVPVATTRTASHPGTFSFEWRVLNRRYIPGQLCLYLLSYQM